MDGQCSNASACPGILIEDKTVDLRFLPDLKQAQIIKCCNGTFTLLETDPSLSLCNVKSSAQCNVVILFFFRNT